MSADMPAVGTPRHTCRIFRVSERLTQRHCRGSPSRPNPSRTNSPRSWTHPAVSRNRNRHGPRRLDGHRQEQGTVRTRTAQHEAGPTATSPTPAIPEHPVPTWRPTRPDNRRHPGPPKSDVAGIGERRRQPRRVRAARTRTVEPMDPTLHPRRVGTQEHDVAGTQEATREPSRRHVTTPGNTGLGPRPAKRLVRRRAWRRIRKVGVTLRPGPSGRVVNRWRKLFRVGVRAGGRPWQHEFVALAQGRPSLCPRPAHSLPSRSSRRDDPAPPGRTR